MNKIKHRSLNPSKMKKPGGNGKKIALVGAGIITTLVGIDIANDYITARAEKKDMERQLQTDVKATKIQIATLDRRFLSDFKDAAWANVPDFVTSYWGVDRLGDRALVVVFKNGKNPQLTVLKFSAASLPELSPLGEDMLQFIKMSDKTQSPIYTKIFDGRLTHSTEHGYVKSKELGDSLAYHSDNYSNGTGSFNSAMWFLLMNNSNYQNSSKMHSYTTDQLQQNRAAFAKSESRSNAYSGGGGGAGYVGGYSGKSQAIGSRAGIGKGG